MHSSSRRYPVLYVDDESDLLAMGKAFLERLGNFIVDTVDSPAAAIAKIQSGYYYAVVTDYEMPGINGIELLRKVRESGDLIPMIIFTGKGREEVVIEALNSGADFYLQKGGDPRSQFAELAHKLQSAIERREALDLIRLNEQQLRSISETIPGVLFEFYAYDSGKTGFSYISSKCEEMLGIPVPSSGDLTCISRAFTERIHPDDLQGCLASISKAIRNETRWDYEGRFVKDVNMIIFFRGISDPVRTGDVIRCSGVLLDITRQKENEQIVLAQQQLTGFLASTSSLADAYEYCVKIAVETSRLDCGGFYLVDLRTGGLNLVYSQGVSPDFAREVRNPPPESYPRTISLTNRPAYLSFDDLKDLPVSRMYASEGIRSLAVVPVIYQERLVGCFTIGSHSLDIIPEPKRRALEAITSGFWNAIIRIRAEEELQASEQRFRLLAEASCEGIIIYHNRVIVDINEKAGTMFGHTRKEITGRTIEVLGSQAFTAVIRELENKQAGQSSEIQLENKDGTICWIEVRVNTLESGDQILYIITLLDITPRKLMEEGLRKRIIALTRPLDDPGTVNFSDLFNLEDIQHIQDTFSEATRVGALITRPDGTPITRPSNFCRLCEEIIRGSESGRQNCFRSDAVLGRYNPSGPNMQPCLSGGLWDAGVSITVGGKHVANWLVGQVKNEEIDEEEVLAYAERIGVDREVFRQALAEVPVMKREIFEKVSESLFLFANELSTVAYQNMLQARFISERQKVEEELKRSNKQLHLLTNITRHDILVYPGKIYLFPDNPYGTFNLLYQG